MILMEPTQPQWMVNKCFCRKKKETGETEIFSFTWPQNTPPILNEPFYFEITFYVQLIQ